MWFRKKQSRPDSVVRGGAAFATKRSQKFGPRVVEALETRALMSMGGQVMPMGNQVMPMGNHGHHHPHTSIAQTNLVSDVAGQAANMDTDMHNPWGLVRSPSGPWWVNDNGTGLSTIYNGSGVKQSPKVTIPPPAGSPANTTAAPTGIVFNTDTNPTDFTVNGTKATFMFATEDGTISAWNGSAGTNAVLKVDNSKVPFGSLTGSVYKGLAEGSTGSSTFLYATNFRGGTIDVFDSSFHQVSPGTDPTITGTFSDPRLPRGFAPFGIANINGNLFVTYAKQKPDKHDDVAGRGLGIVDEFDTSGHLIERVATRGMLNSPWGLVVAPSSFGQFAGDLLVGDFGDGRINAYRPLRNGKFAFDGQLRDAQNHPIAIDGLWGLAVGNGGTAGPSSTVFFTAGINGEADGLFGTLTASTM